MEKPKRGRGRPAKTPEERCVVKTISFPGPLYRKALAALPKGRSLSELVQTALAQHLNQQ